MRRWTWVLIGWIFMGWLVIFPESDLWGASGDQVEKDLNSEKEGS